DLLAGGEILHDAGLQQDLAAFFGGGVLCVCASASERARSLRAGDRWITRDERREEVLDLLAQQRCALELRDLVEPREHGGEPRNAAHLSWAIDAEQVEHLARRHTMRIERATHPHVVARMHPP